MQVTGIVEQVEGSVDSDWIVAVGGAEHTDVEGESLSFATACPNLIEISKMVVHIINIFLWREILFYASVQRACVISVPQQYGICLLSVAASTSCFLKIGFY